MVAVSRCLDCSGLLLMTPIPRASSPTDVRYSDTAAANCAPITLSSRAMSMSGLAVSCA